jgi:hypothetical protein
VAGEEREATLRIGVHEITWEPPHIFVVRLVGDVSGEETNQVFDVFERWAAGGPRAFWLVDLDRVGEMPSEARKAGGERTARSAAADIVCVGGSFEQRLVMKLAVTAAQLLAGWRNSAPPTFKATEAEARAWIEERRAALAAAKADRPGGEGA